MLGPGGLGSAFLRELGLLGPGQGAPGVDAVGFLLFPFPQVVLAAVSLHLFCLQVYDTPPMAVKGPNGRDPSLDVYDVPPSVEKGLLPSSHHAVSSWGVLGTCELRPHLGWGATECVCWGGHPQT